MTGLETAVAGATLITAIIGIPGSVYAVIVARRSVKSQDAATLALAVVTSPEFRAQASELARSAAADRIQVLINDRHYMPRELQEDRNEEINRRLGDLEKKVNDVPRETANHVLQMLRARET